jgi:hypothetical protein
MRMKSALVAAAGGLLSVSAAQAQIQIIYSNLVGNPGNVVPGLSNGWKAGTTSQFDRVFLSPDNSRWVIGGFANEATTADRVIVSGMGPTRTGAVLIMQEGPAPWAVGRNVSFVDTELSINDSGQIAAAIDLDGSTADDECLVVFNQLGFESLILREDTVEPTGLFAGNNVGATIDSPNMMNDGRVGYKTLFDGPGTATPVLPLTANNNDFLMIAPVGPGAHTIIAQEGVTPVEPAGPNWDLFDAGDFFLSGDGTRWIAQGNDEGATTTDQVLVYDNGTGADVAIREGDIIYAGVGTATTAALDAFMSRNGAHWITNGSNSGTTPPDWVVKNGVLVSATDGDITPFDQSGELFDDAIFTTTFFSVAVNNAGDYIVGGVTNATDVNANAVLVLNGSRVVVREGDPVDADGNGQLDDGVHISVFNNFDLALSDDLHLYFMADLRNEALQSLGQAFLVLNLNQAPPCDPDLNQDGNADQDDVSYLIDVIAGGPNPTGIDPDFNGDGNVDQDDVSALINVIAGGPCP